MNIKQKYRWVIITRVLALILASLSVFVIYQVNLNLQQIRENARESNILGDLDRYLTRFDANQAFEKDAIVAQLGHFQKKVKAFPENPNSAALELSLHRLQSWLTELSERPQRNYLLSSLPALRYHVIESQKLLGLDSGQLSLVLSRYWLAFYLVTSLLVAALLILSMVIKASFISSDRILGRMRAFNKQWLRHRQKEIGFNKNLRTRLSTVVGNSEVLLFTDLTNHQLDCAEEIKKSSQEILYYLFDLQDIGRVVKDNPINYQSVDLYRFVESLHPGLQLRMQRGDSYFTYELSKDLPLEITTDVFVLQKIFFILSDFIVQNLQHMQLHLSVQWDDRQKAIVFMVGDREGVYSQGQTIAELIRHGAMKHQGTGVLYANHLIRLMNAELYLHRQNDLPLFFRVNFPSNGKKATIAQTDLFASRSFLADIRVCVGADNPAIWHILESCKEFWGINHITLFLEFDEIEEAHFENDLVLIASQKMIDGDSGSFQQLTERDKQGHLKLLLVSQQTRKEMTGDGSRSKTGPVLVLANPLHSVLLQKLVGVVEKVKENKVESLVERFPFRILVVEDNVSNQKVMGRMLEHLGYRPRFADDGEHALEVLSEEGFDLVFMDLELPNKTGVEVTQEFRSMPGGDVPVIIAISATTWQHMRTQCVAVGMNDFVEKPFTRDQLEATLTKWGKKVFSRSGKSVV